MIDRKIKKYIYSSDATFRSVIQDLYRKQIDICLVCKGDDVLLGILTLGDIKNSIINGFDPDSPIKNIMNVDFVKGAENMTAQSLHKISRENMWAKIPILDRKGRVGGIYIRSRTRNGFKHKTVLVTGGAGYVGSILCRKLLERGYRVVALDKLIFGINAIKDLLNHKNFTLRIGDLNNAHDLMMGIQDSDFVVHLAGIVGDPASSIDPTHTLESNHFSTKFLIDLSRYYQVSRFVFASSCSVYGASKKVSNEDSKPNPVSLYARTKLSSERDLLRSSDRYFNPVILRFGTLYGLSPRMRLDLVVNTMTANGYFNNKIIVDGGLQWRPFLHVADAAEACMLAIEAPLDKVKGQIFNVGLDEHNYKIKDIASIIHKFLPKSKLIKRSEGKDRRDYKVSFQKIAALLNFRASYSLEEGICEMTEEMAEGKYKKFQDKKYNNHLSFIGEET